jgi:hypothetical protein
VQLDATFNMLINNDRVTVRKTRKIVLTNVLRSRFGLLFYSALGSVSLLFNALRLVV